MRMRKRNSKSAGWVVGLLVVGVVSVCMAAAPPRLEPWSNGKWPEYTRGTRDDVKVVGNRAYVALGRRAGDPGREQSGQPGAVGRI